MPLPDDTPEFDVHSKCVKCGNEIPEPEPVPPPPAPAGPPGAPVKAPAKKAAPKETAAAPPPPKAPLAMPVKAPPPTVAYCNGLECPWYEGEEVDEHLHQFCDVCGYEWIAHPLDHSKT